MLCSWALGSPPLSDLLTFVTACQRPSRPVHSGGMVSTFCSTHAGSGIIVMGVWWNVVEVMVCVVEAVVALSLFAGCQSKFLGEWASTGWCCCGCVLAPPSLASEYTLPAHPLQQTRLNERC